MRISDWSSDVCSSDLQLPKGATPVDFAYAVHTGLGDRTVGAKVNGRLVPLRTQLSNGDTVEILSSDKQTPPPAWLSFAVTGKARAAIRRHVRSKEKIELAALGRTMSDAPARRLPTQARTKPRAAPRPRRPLHTHATPHPP